MALSAAFTVEGNANPARHEVVYGSTVDLALTSEDGATSIVWEIMGCSDPEEPIPAITYSGSPYGKTASFVMPADSGDTLGRTFLVRCTLSNQTRGADGEYERAYAYGVVGAVNSQGRLPIVPGEKNYRHGTHGWAPEINELLNGAGGGGGGGGGGWTDDGSTVRLTSASDSVAIGTASLSGTEKLRVIGNSRFEQATATSGNPKAFYVSGAGHTGLQSGSEVIDVDFALDRTVQRNAGAVATSRAFVVRAPTYSFVGSSTVTDAATFAITGAPAAGTNATLTNSYSLWVQAGTVRFGGMGAGVVQASATGVLSSGTLSIVNGGTGLTSAGGVANRVLITTNGTTFSTGQIDLATMVTGQIGTTGLADGSVTPAKINQSGATAGQAWIYSGSAWAPSTNFLAQNLYSTGYFGSIDTATNSATASAATFRGGDATGTGGTGAAVTVRSGDATGASGTRTGGALTLRSGTGATAAGSVRIQRGSTIVANWVGSSSDYLALGASPATTGAIRLAQASKVIGLSSGSVDRTLLDWGTTTADEFVVGDNAVNLSIKAAGATTLSTAGVARINFSSSIRFYTTTVQFDAAVTSPNLTQETNVSATATGQAFTFSAQDCSGTTSVTAGALTVRSGDATGGAGTRNGGALTIRSGTGVTSIGNLTIQAGTSYNLLTYDDVSARVTVGNTSRPLWLTSDVNVRMAASGGEIGQFSRARIYYFGDAFQFSSGSTAPSIYQETETSATITCDAFTINAQDGSGTTNVTAGAMTLRAGDATGGSGTRNGGALTLRSGTGATSYGALSVLGGSGAGGLQIAARNNALSAYISMVYWDGVNTRTILGDTAATAYIYLQSSIGQLRFGTNSTLDWTASAITPQINALSWGAVVPTAPTINQATATGATATGAPFTLNAQDCSGTSSVTAGALTVRAGDATGASGTRNGGALTIRSGTGVTSHGAVTMQRGSVSIFDASATQTRVGEATLSDWVLASTAQLRINSVAQLTVSTSSITVKPSQIVFASNTSLPNITQATDTAATATGRTLQIKAQDCSGTTLTIGGALYLQAGSATGASGSRTGGELALSSGSGTTPGEVTIFKGVDAIFQTTSAAQGSLFIGAGTGPVTITAGGAVDYSIYLRPASPNGVVHAVNLYSIDLDTDGASGSSYDFSFSVQGTQQIRFGKELGASVLGFYGINPVVKPTVTGSRGGNAALASLLTALANLGLLTNSSS